MFENLSIFRKSLRVRLLAVIAVVVATASFPLIYFSYQDSYDRAVNSAHKAFETTADLIAEALQLSYLNSQTIVAEKVSLERGYISEKLDVLGDFITAGDVDKLKAALIWENQGGTYATVITPEGQLLTASPVIAALYEKNVQDYLGKGLQDYLGMATGGDFARDFFSFVRADTPKRRMTPLLIAGRRLSDGSLLVIAEELDYLEDSQQQRLAAVESHLKETVQALSTDSVAVVRVMSGSGRFITGRKVDRQKDRLAPFGHVLAEAREKTKTTGAVATEAGVLLYSVQYFRPLDWYIEVGAPEFEVTEPARIYAAKLTAIVLTVFLILAFAGLASVTRVLRPLRAVAESADQLGSVNFASNETKTLLTAVRHLPVQRQDEIGRVADAFVRMTHALEKNIEDLKGSVARQHSMEGELNAAREIQEGMLIGHDRLELDRFAARAVMRAAKEVGGDLYDILPLSDGRIALVVGDVSGKGVSAAMLMCVTLTLIRQDLADGLTPAGVMKKVNDQLARNNPNCMFVTLWIGIFNPKTLELTFANGGHCPPAVVSEGGEVRWVRDMSGPLVGVFEDAQFADHTLLLDSKETVVVYSDGVTEAMNANKVLFGESGLAEALKRNGNRAPQTILDGVMRSVMMHRGEAEQSDDITLLSFGMNRQEAK